jgi:murein DD-endopeptidase MepM/ murein hydrolase activator NlpD
LALVRSPSGAEPALAGGYGARYQAYRPSPPRRGHHRASAPASPWQGRVAIAAVAAGATVAAAQSLTGFAEAAAQRYDVARTADDGALIVSAPDTRPAAVRRGVALPAHSRSVERADPELSALDGHSDVADVASLTKAVAVGQRLARDALRVRDALAGGAPAAAIFRGQEFVKPTTGVFTSGYGARWGTVHYGIDLANRIGTPIYAVTDGTVISSGPASGFGLWVRLLHPGGWITVYGHINRSLVHLGQKVRAGQEIAEMGSRGQATGPHLHFEVWDPNGRKINPVPWLAIRGIRVTGSGSGPAAD